MPLDINIHLQVEGTEGTPVHVRAVSSDGRRKLSATRRRAVRIASLIPSVVEGLHFVRVYARPRPRNVALDREMRRCGVWQLPLPLDLE
jgi:hypothetical protein